MGVAGEVSRRGLTHGARGLLVRAVWQSKVPNGMVSFPPNGGAPHNTCAQQQHSCEHSRYSNPAKPKPIACFPRTYYYYEYHYYGRRPMTYVSDYDDYCRRPNTSIIANAVILRPCIGAAW